MAGSDLHVYLTEIGRHPVLTKEAQLRHCQRIHAWVNHEHGKAGAPMKVQKSGRRSMDVMVRTNLRLVVSIAKKYMNRGMDICDLIQEGNIGLMRGMELFDPTRGYQVSTYVYWWIRQGITRAIYSQSRTIRIPSNTYEIISKIRRYIERHEIATGLTPTHTEIAIHLDIKKEKVASHLAAYDLTRCSSLDRVLGDYGGAGSAGDTSRYELIVDSNTTPDNNPDKYLDRHFHTEQVVHAMCHLTEAERYIVTSVFDDGKTFNQLGKELGRSSQAINQAHLKILRKLRLRVQRSPAVSL